MNAAMVHRGPDDEGTHLSEPLGVAIGARRLSIIDVDGGHQPIGNEDGTIWAVLNGEIYNHPALQELLRSRGHTLRTRTDTEVLVHLYEEYGDDLVHALEGMFAFAIVDERKGRLIVARDRFGEKPLFYTVRGGSLVFASELDALLAGSGAGFGARPGRGRSSSSCLATSATPRCDREPCAAASRRPPLSWDVVDRTARAAALLGHARADQLAATRDRAGPRR